MFIHLQLDLFVLSGKVGGGDCLSMCVKIGKSQQSWREEKSHVWNSIIPWWVLNDCGAEQTLAVGIQGSNRTVFPQVTVPGAWTVDLFTLAWMTKETTPWSPSLSPSPQMVLLLLALTHWCQPTLGYGHLLCDFMASAHSCCLLL